MNKRVLVGLFLLSAMPVVSFAAPAWRAKKCGTRDVALVKNFVASYLGSVMVGGGIGMVTGGIMKYLENGTKQYLAAKWEINSAPVSLLLTLLSWAFESEVRNDLVVGLQGDLDQYEIEYKRIPMLRSAQIAAWLTYLGM